MKTINDHIHIISHPYLTDTRDEYAASVEYILKKSNLHPCAAKKRARVFADKVHRDILFVQKKKRGISKKQTNKIDNMLGQLIRAKIREVAYIDVAQFRNVLSLLMSDI